MQISPLIKPVLNLATQAVELQTEQDARERLEAVCCEIHLKQVDDVVVDLLEAVSPMFEEQITAIGRGLLDLEKRGGVPDQKTAGETGLSWVDMVFSPAEWDSVLVDRVLPPLAVNMGRAAMAQLEVMGFGGLRGGVRATSASDWLAGQGDLIALEDVVFDTPYGNVPMRIATEWPEWMKREVKKQLNESFAQPYWRKVNETTRADVGRHIERGLLEGRGIESMARSMQDDLLEEGRYALRRGRTIARTECLPADTIVSGARPIAVHRRWYDGPWIEIITKAGRKFAGTPNHPMLTQRGWVGFGDLLKSDCLVCQKIDAEFSGTSGNMDVEKPPSTIGEIFDSFSAIGVFERRRTTEPDFHGDGLDGDVDIFASDRFLSYGNFVPVEKCFVENVLSESDASKVLFAAVCNPFPRGNTDTFSCLASCSKIAPVSYDCFLNRRSVDIERFCDRWAIFARGISRKNFIDRRIKILGVGAIAGSQHQLAGFFEVPSGNTSLLASAPYNTAMAIKQLGDFDTTQAGQIEIDHPLVIRRIESWSGHVFNLSTRDGYFSIANGLYTGNSGNALNGARKMSIDNLAAELGPEVPLTASWLSVLGNTTRDTHANLHGVIANADGLWSLGGVMIPWPSHTSLPARERVSCQCTVLHEFGATPGTGQPVQPPPEVEPLPVAPRRAMERCGGLPFRALSATCVRSRSEIAKAKSKRVGKDIQRYSEERNERDLAGQFGRKAKSLDDNQPIDVEWRDGDKVHGIELKTMVDNKNNKITMKPQAIARKAEWERPRNRTMHTVVFDDAAVVPGRTIAEKTEALNRFLEAGDATGFDFAARRIFYRRGYGGFRVGGMHEVTGGVRELRRLMRAALRDLPVGAKGWG